MVFKHGDDPTNYTRVALSEEASEIVEINWTTDKLTLNGDYSMTLEFSKEDVAKLFLVAFKGTDLAAILLALDAASSSEQLYNQALDKILARIRQK